MSATVTAAGSERASFFSVRGCPVPCSVPLLCARRSKAGRNGG